MSIEIMQEVWKKAPVDQGTLLVLLALADSADECSRTCYPGVSSLSSKSRLSERQVQYCLQRLREAGVISVKRNASPVKTNLYRIEPIETWRDTGDAIIAPHGKKADTQSAACRDEVGCVSDTKWVAPKPSVTVSIEPSVGKSDLFGEEKKEATSKPGLSKPFDGFWKAYPKKAGKPAAQKAFEKAIKAGADPEAIITGAKRYALCEAVAKGFTKHPQGWLNDERWNDADLPELPIDDAARKFPIGSPQDLAERRRRLGPKFGEVVR
jgi:hypothetical protein